MKRLLITGASGFLGSRIVDFYKERYEVYAPSHGTIDITDEKNTADKIAAWMPDVIVHCAAVSDVGSCEKEPERSWKINVDGSIHVAKAAGRIHAKCLLCSSDQVYFGSSLDGPHSEQEKITPCNLYGKQKRKAEEECLSANPDCILLRLSWMYDIRTLNNAEHGDFIRTFLAAMERAEPLRFPIYDVRGISDVNEVVRNLEKAISLEGGIYNFGSPNERNTYETMLEVFRNLQWDTSRLQKDEHAFLSNPRNISMRQERINGGGIFFSETAEALAHNIRRAAMR